MNPTTESLQQLVAAVEQSGANLAPTYQEYMPLAFAVANSCGEEGRSWFHRLCRISEKYEQQEADRLYDHALQTGRGGNSLGTVFHLAERAGVKLDRKLANLQNLQPPHTHTQARACEANAPLPVAACEEEAPAAPALPCFDAYGWPGFLQQVVDWSPCSAPP